MPFVRHSRLGSHRAPSPARGPAKEIFFRLLSREEQPVLHRLMIRDEAHPVMRGASGLLDHESPAWPGLGLNDLPPVVGSPARRFAAPEPEIDLLEQRLRDVSESGPLQLSLPLGKQTPGASSLSPCRRFCETGTERSGCGPGRKPVSRQRRRASLSPAERMGGPASPAPSRYRRRSSILRTRRAGTRPAPGRLELMEGSWTQ